MQTWNLIDAQNHLEDLIQSALDHRPQRIELGFGVGAVVMLDEGDFARLTHHDQLTFMQSSPVAKAIAEDGLDFEIDRSDDFDREAELPDSTPRADD
jgi:hypothetical protein